MSTLSTSLYTPFISLMTNHTMESIADLIRHSESAVGVFEALAETDTLELSTGFRFKDMLICFQRCRDSEVKGQLTVTEEPLHCTLWEEQALYRSLKASHTGYLNSQTEARAGDMMCSSFLLIGFSTLSQISPHWFCDPASQGWWADLCHHLTQH